MSDIFIHRVEQLATWEQQPAALDFTFWIGIEVGDLPTNTENEVIDDTIYPTAKGVAV